MIQDQFTCGEEGHDDQQLNFLCLNYNCKNNSPCCQLCVQQFHKEHSIQCQQLNQVVNYLDDTHIKPLEQKFLTGIEQQRNQFQDKVKAIRQVLKSKVQGKKNAQALEKYSKELEKIDSLIITMNTILQNATNEFMIDTQETNDIEQTQETDDIEKIPGYQKFLTTLTNHLEANRQFEDPDFPPNQTSAGFPVFWTRIGEYCKKDIKFFYSQQNFFGSSNEMQMRDIMQGLKGNELLCQVIFLIANSQKNALKRVFFTSEISENNIYALILQKDGNEQIIVVDDYIPYSFEYEIPETVVGSNSCIWISILEKGLAKVLGSYSKLIFKCPPPKLIETILCGPTINLDSSDPSLFSFIREELSQNCFLSCYDDATEDFTICQILGIEKIQQQELIVLRSSKENWWTGDWSHTSNKWTSKIDVTSKAKRGIFYMDLLSFIQYFPLVYSCRFNSNQKNQLLVSQRKNQATYVKLIVKNSGRYVITLRSKDEYIHKNIPNKITLVKSEDNTYTYIDSFFNTTLGKSSQFNLTQGTYYGYMRIYWKEQQEDDAIITISGSSQLQLTQTQKIPDLMRQALIKEAKLKGVKKVETGIETYILDIQEKGWYVNALINNSQYPRVMILPNAPSPLQKYMKPHHADYQLNIYPGQTQALILKTVLELKNPIKVFVGLVTGGM